MRRSTVAVTLLVGVLLGTVWALGWRLYDLGAFSTSSGTSISVRFESDPPGAMLVSNDSGTVLGTAPFTLTYLAPHQWASCVAYDGFRARWTGGSQVVAQRLELCPGAGREQSIRVAAPKGAGAGATKPGPVPSVVPTSRTAPDVAIVPAGSRQSVRPLAAPPAVPHTLARPPSAPTATRPASTTQSAPEPQGRTYLREASPPPPTPPAVAASTTVWVNAKSHVYHCPGTRYFGTTVSGSYMLETRARASGNRPAYGRTCGPLASAGDHFTQPAASSAVEAPQSRVSVWVNTRSHVYHCQGTRYYGNTAAGTFMSEGDALKFGNRPAYGRSC